MVLDFSRFDGKWEPRPAQEEIIEWLRDPEVWKHDLIGFNAGTGTGKMPLLKAVQVAGGGVSLVPNNMLMGQATKNYPTANFLKGKAHYMCTKDMSCQDKKDMGEKPCTDCKYKKCRSKALHNVPTYFNPISYYYLKKNLKFFDKDKASKYAFNGKPKIMLIDEADAILKMLMLLCGKEFREGRYNLPDTDDLITVIEWLKIQVDNLTTLAYRHREAGEYKQLSRVNSERENIEFVLEGLQDNPQNYAVYFDEKKYRNQMRRYLNVMPLHPPLGVLRNMFECEKLIITSATLFEKDMERFALGKDFVYKDFGSPIAPKNRRIYFHPAPFKMNFMAKPDEVAAEIQKVIDKRPNRNTLIHVTYGWMNKLKEFFPEAITHTNDAKEKQAAIDKFKEEGGILLGAGMAEGLDLAGDQCRLNIIPFLYRENIKNPVVEKRLAKPGGNFEYGLEVMRNTIQRAGRSTRGEDDFSETFVLDPTFSKEVQKYKKHLPKSFVEAIVWRKVL